MALRSCNEQVFCSVHEDTETPRTHALYEPKLLLESEMLLLLLMAWPDGHIHVEKLIEKL